MDPVLEGQVRSIAKSWELGLADHILDRYLNIGIVIAMTAYRHTPCDTQVAIALYTFGCVISDDPVMSNEVLREFVPRFFDGRTQLHPILSRLAAVLAILRRQYSTFSGNAIVISTMEFFNAEMFLRDEGGCQLSEREAPEYVDYMRGKTGIGEAYAAFIWPRALFPETKTYIQAMSYAAQFSFVCNDLMSYYKEAKAGETDNYVALRTATCGQSVVDTLEELANRLVHLDERIKAILGDSPERRTWELFTSGYIEFHLCEPRYLLKDLLPECF